MKNILLLAFAILILGCSQNHQRDTQLLSGSGWHAWMDTAAKWRDDSLYLPGEFELDKLPVNAPSGGWENLNSMGKECDLPASIEELFGTSNDWTYHGVSWFWKNIDVPQEWIGKKIFLKVNQYRHRIEILINQKLAGYDLIALAPYEVEVSKFLKAGKNQIAFRITNPGGVRGWEDFYLIKWGNYRIPATHDFCGIGGDISLYATDDIYIKDVFVKNLLPIANQNVKIEVAIENDTKENTNADYTVKITSNENGKTVFSKNYQTELQQGTNLVLQQVEIPEAQKWSLDSPNLYTCHIIMNSGECKDYYSQVFGFRIFETKAVDGKKNYYLNGKRIRIRSAIDWGEYALTGLYPSSDMAENSVKSAKAIDHNCISFHRRIGEPAIMDNADKLGLFIYEEPGGLHTQRGWDDADMEKSPFAMKWMEEKIRRMVIRDRNHPSVIIYSLANEDNNWNPFRENLMKMINQMDDSRLIVNASSNGGGKEDKGNNVIRHIKVYSSLIDSDYYDEHTVNSGVGFDEKDFTSHTPKPDSIFTYWGEVRCYAGPPCAWQIVHNCSKKSGFDMNLFKPLSDKIDEYFSECNIASCGSGVIKTPADITLQTGRGLMYVDGRIDQIILSHNATDGFAINGWSDGPQTLDPWSSAITDAARNLKGPGEDYRFWNKPLQIAIFRANGKYFKPGDTAKFNVRLINEGLLEAGEYDLIFKLKDGEGKYSTYKNEMAVKVLGGDVFAQPITDGMPVLLDNSLKGGYITIEASLMKDNKTVTSGIEQVMLTNRKSFSKDLSGSKIFVSKWPSASKVLKETGIAESTIQNATVILTGDIPDNSTLEKILQKVNEGSKCIIRFDSLWAIKLFEKKILSEPVIAWGGKQTPFWNGNGWGYIDYLIGDQAAPSKTIISTRGWEVAGDPRGFWPFKSQYKKEAYGAYIARKQTLGYVWDKPEVHKMYEKMFPEERQLLVMYGAIYYGKGKIILAPSYPVDDNNPLNDLIFYNMILK
jgi:beta-galactosidase